MCTLLVNRMNPQYQVTNWRQKGAAPEAGTCWASNKVIAAAGGVSLSTFDRMMKPEAIGGLLFDTDRRPNKTTFRSLSVTALQYMLLGVAIVRANRSDAWKLYQLDALARVLLPVPERKPVGRPMGSVITLRQPAPARKINCDVSGMPEAPNDGEINCDGRIVKTTPILKPTSKPKDKNRKVKHAGECSKNIQVNPVKTLALVGVLNRILTARDKKPSGSRWWAEKRKHGKPERDINAIPATQNYIPQGFNGDAWKAPENIAKMPPAERQKALAAIEAERQRVEFARRYEAQQREEVHFEVLQQQQTGAVRGAGYPGGGVRTGDGLSRNRQDGGRASDNGMGSATTGSPGCYAN